MHSLLPCTINKIIQKRSITGLINLPDYCCFDSSTALLCRFCSATLHHQVNHLAATYAMQDQYTVLLQYLNPPGSGRVLDECTKEVPDLISYADTIFSDNILLPSYFIYFVNSSSLSPIAFLFLIHSLSPSDLFLVLYLAIRKTSPVSFPSILRRRRVSLVIKPILYFLILFKLRQLEPQSFSFTNNSSEFAKHYQLSIKACTFPIYFLSYLLVLPLSLVLQLPSMRATIALSHGMKSVSASFLLSD